MEIAITLKKARRSTQYRLSQLLSYSVPAKKEIRANKWFLNQKQIN